MSNSVFAAHRNSQFDAIRVTVQFTNRLIGGCPKDDLKKAGIDPVDKYAHEFIEQSAIAYFMEYVAKVKAGEIAHQIRGDADIRQGAYTAAA